VTARLTRRGALELLAAGAVAGSLAAGGAPARAAQGTLRLSPPDAPMLFRRRLLREMSGGNAIVVERGFELRFLPLGHGYRVEGTQVSSAVETPPVLAQIAELERKRVDSGVFPVELDPDGLVLDGASPDARPTPGLDEAVDLALARLRERGVSGAQLADANAFFLWLQQAAGTIGAEMPRELFVPPAEPQQVTRVVALPGGGSGTIETRFWGSISPQTGLMQTAERDIVTRTEETSRRTVETWSLTPA